MLVAEVTEGWFPGTGIPGSCKTPYGSWKLKLGFSGRAVSTQNTESSVQSLKKQFLINLLEKYTSEK